MEIGDVVFLKSNPELLMTVSFILGKTKVSGYASLIQQQMKISGFIDGDVQCTWFKGSECKVGFFKSAMLSKKE
jgi:uncharacterized protein YodC (DUF2158 family)